MYEAEYKPTLAHANPEPKNGVPADRLPHSCLAGIDGDSCADNYFRICDHHCCGEDCAFECYDFVCETCQGPFNDNDNADQLMIHAKMYEAADKYDVASLKALCIEKYKRACRKFWNHAKFAESAYHVYCTTPLRDKGLRNIVTKTLSDHMSLLEKPEIEDLTTEFNGLAFGLLFDKAKQSGWCNK